MGGVHLDDDLVRGLSAAIGFLTNIPVHIQEGDYECFLARIYLFVPIGLLIGLLLGVAGLVLLWLLPTMPVAALIVCCLYLITGINHVDGLSDMGDGLAATGPREKKISAMKDVHAGTGGVMAIGLDLLLLFVLIQNVSGSGALLVYALIVAEVCAKVAMTGVIAYGKSMGPGMGAMAIAAARKDHFAVGFAFAGTAILFAAIVAGTVNGDLVIWKITIAGIAALLSPLAVSVVLRNIADRNFGGVNGDVIGAANEIGRITALVVMGVVLWMHW